MGKFVGNGKEIYDLLPKVDYHSVWKNHESFTRHVKSFDKSKAWTDAGWDKGNADFYGTNSMEEALTLAENGWKEGIEKVEKMSKLISALNPELTQLAKYGIAGATPNVPRAIAGDPLNMRVPEPVSSKRRPVLTLLYNMCEAGYQSPNRITIKAAAMTALVDRIEAKNYSCEVVATALVSTDYNFKKGKRERTGFSAATTIVVKQCNQPVDVAKVAFGLGHASMFRRMIFADWANDPECKQLGGHLGYVNEFTSQPELTEKYVYMIPRGLEHFKDEKIAAEKGVPWLIEKLKEQGCPAFTRDVNQFVEHDVKSADKDIEHDDDDDDDD